MKTVAIVQARLGSRRLPNKMLLDLAGNPVLERTLKRIKRARTLDEVVLATTRNPEDQPLIRLAEGLGCPVFAGDENDVLDRFYQAALVRSADRVVRITGDCPLHDPEIIDRVVNAFVASTESLDYASNVAPPTYPDGLDVEVFPFSVLARVWSEATDAADREHVTTYVRNRSSHFRTLNVVHDGDDLSELRWTLDEQADLEFLREVFRAFNGRDDFSWCDVLSYLKNHPGQANLNRGIARNLGWMDSALNGKLAPPLTIKRSDELWAKSRDLIPAGTQTLSKGPTQFVDGVAPKYLARGQGSHVWDVDGNEFIDYPMGLGPITLGHCHPVTQEAVEATRARCYLLDDESART